MQHAEPPVVYPEALFEEALAPVIQACAQLRSGTVVRRFGLDFAVFAGEPSRTNVLFIEVKSYGGQRVGSVGFGNGKGGGPQVDILLCGSGQLPTLDGHIRWAIADATQAVGTARYALLSCSEACGAVMGSVARGKQNNFRLSAVKPHLVAWAEFCERLIRFMDNGQPTGRS